MAEGREGTYVEAARRGGHRWWRYLLGLGVVLGSFAIVGGVASVVIALVLGGDADFSGLGPVAGFVVTMVGFPFFLAGIVIAVRFVHRRHPRTLVTARPKISWRRVGLGFTVWFVLWLATGLVQYLLYPDRFSVNPDLVTFALFVPLAVVLTAIQTTTEELFFRGYVVQAASLVWAGRVFLALVSAVVFTLPHLANPEVNAPGGWLTVLFGYFLGMGLVWVVVSLVDGTTELAIGAHFANNIANILVVNTAGTAVIAPALFRASEYDATFDALSVLVIAPLFLLTVLRLFGRNGSAAVPGRDLPSNAASSDGWSTVRAAVRSRAGISRRRRWSGRSRSDGRG